MTHPALGRALPVHFYMASLAGWGVNNPRIEEYMADYQDYDFLEDEVKAVQEICAGRAGLVRMTLNDFGFDLAQWRSFFVETWQADPNGSETYRGWGYGHPYAASVVDKIVLDGMEREGRPRLEALAETAWPDLLLKRLAWYQTEWKDPEEPLWLAAVRDWPFE